MIPYRSSIGLSKIDEKIRFRAIYKRTLNNPTSIKSRIGIVKAISSNPRSVSCRNPPEMAIAAKGYFVSSSFHMLFYPRLPLGAVPYIQERGIVHISDNS
jgi:hypothetical protein